MYVMSQVYKTRKKLSEESFSMQGGDSMDVSELQQRQLGKVLWESAHLYQVLFESVNEGLIVIDSKTLKVLLCNHVAVQICGFESPEDALGINPIDFIHPDDKDRVLTIISNEMFEKDLQQTSEFRIITREGKEKWISASGARVQYREEMLGLVSFRDITEQKHAEDALRQSEEKIRLIFESIGDGIIVTDLDGNIVEVNNSLLLMSGRSKEEFTGKNVFSSISDKDKSRVAEDMQKTLENGHARDNLEYTVLNADGKEFEAEFSGGVMRDTRGNPTGLIGVIRDITERKRHEAELNEMLKDLERSNAELEQFAYVASHDLQEPLRMISSYVELLAEDYQDKLGVEADEFIGYAVDGAQRMQDMIVALLEYSRVGTRGNPFEIVDCENVIQQATDNLQLAIEESGALVSHDPLPKVMADQIQLVQLFQNLISNAIKFRSEEPPRIHISSKHEKKGQAFSVIDNGIGIAPEYQERIFVIFQRLHDREEYPGTGIGLSICKRIVERHGGQIWVESEPGKGSTFYFTIAERGKKR